MQEKRRNWAGLSLIVAPAKGPQRGKPQDGGEGQVRGAGELPPPPSLRGSGSSARSLGDPGGVHGCGGDGG